MASRRTTSPRHDDSPRGTHGIAVHCGVPPLPSSGATRSSQTTLGNSNVPGGPLLILRRPPLKALFLPSWSTYQEAPSRGPPAALLCPSQGPSCPPPAALLGGPLGGLFAPPTCPPRGASETAVSLANYQFLSPRSARLTVLRLDRTYHF